MSGADERPDEDDLALGRGGLRFIDPSRERHYRHWRNTQNLPVIRLNGAVSIPPWLAAPWLGYLWRPDIDWFSLWWLGMVLPVPMLSLALLSTYSRYKDFATLICAAALLSAGGAMLWIIPMQMHGIEGFDSSGSLTGTIVLLGCFALFMRLPPLLAMLAITPFTLGAMALILYRFQQGELSALYAYPYTTIPGVMLFFIGVISAAQERFYRRAYLSEVTVGRQRSALESSHELIRRYVPPAVANQLSTGNRAEIESPQRRRVTVLFSDIVGFTDMADRLDAESLTQVINEYMAAMAQIIQQHEGTLNEFAGDGLMALFGAPVELPPEAQVLAAVRAAQAMQARLPQLNEGWLRLGIGEPLRIRIGINTGVLSVGSFGSQGRMTYTAIGLQTNIAARIQAHCEPGEVLLSDNSWHLIKQQLACEPRGEVSCKGVHFPVKIYAPPLAPVDRVDDESAGVAQ